MTTNALIEKRKSRRFPFSKRDAVYCVVVRAKSVGTTIALSTVDFSETGFQFAIIPTLKGDFFKGEKLYLKAIVGTRNLTFAEPIELAIRWQRYEADIDIVRIGCEICNIATQAEQQFIDFIQSEVKFKGVRQADRPTPQAAIVSPTAPPTSSKASPAADLGTEKPGRAVISVYSGVQAAGPTDMVLGWIEKQLAALGHSVTRLDLSTGTINGCDDCRQCKKDASSPGCVQNDDVPAIFEKMLASDLLLYATPIYFTGVHVKLKALMDRSQCLYRGAGGMPGHTSLLAGRRQALIATAHDPFSATHRQVADTFERLRACHRTIDAGTFWVCNCRTANLMDEQIHRAAKSFARQLFGAAPEPYAMVVPGRGCT